MKQNGSLWIEFVWTTGTLSSIHSSHNNAIKTLPQYFSFGQAFFKERGISYHFHWKMAIFVNYSSLSHLTYQFVLWIGVVVVYSLCQSLPFFNGADYVWRRECRIVNQCKQYHRLISQSNYLDNNKNQKHYGEHKHTMSRQMVKPDHPRRYSSRWSFHIDPIAKEWEPDKPLMGGTSYMHSIEKSLDAVEARSIVLVEYICTYCNITNLHALQTLNSKTMPPTMAEIKLRNHLENFMLNY